MPRCDGRPQNPAKLAHKASRQLAMTMALASQSVSQSVSRLANDELEERGTKFSPRVQV